MKIKKISVTICINLFFLLKTSAMETESVQNEVNLFDLIAQGGWAMWPLGLCSLVMFFLLVFCFQSTHRKRFVTDEAVEKMMNIVRNASEPVMEIYPSDSNTVFIRAMYPALKKIKEEPTEQEKEKIETTFLDNISAEESHLSNWINYLNVIATVSPMIGLLGTVAGMIGAFQTIGAGGMGRPELLAGDIGAALITTATGLIIGIPAMLFYFVLRARMTKQFVQTVQIANTVFAKL